MQINLLIDAGPSPDPVAVEQLIAWATKLDVGSRAYATILGPMQVGSTLDPAQVGSTEAAETVKPNGHDTSEETTSSAADEGEESQAPASTTEVAPKRRGRPPKATAAQQTAALETPPAPTAATTAAPATSSPAVPPGVAIPPGAQQQQPQTQVQQPAMPTAATDTSTAGDAFSLEDLRECIREVVKKDSTLPFKLQRAVAWPSDKTEKDKWFTLEAIPGDLRERFAAELMTMAGG